ncbi:unnamed protein product, partial [Amoebophrya sp. A25]
FAESRASLGGNLSEKACLLFPRADRAIGSEAIAADVDDISEKGRNALGPDFGRYV